MTLVLQHSRDFDVIGIIQLNMHTKNKMSGYVSERERKNKGESNSILEKI